MENEIRRTKSITQQKISVRKELERFVVAWNTVLQGRVSSMNILELLRNAHPLYRSDYAYKLKDVGLLQREQITEFINTPVSSVTKLYKRYV